MPSPNSQRQKIIDQVIHRLNAYTGGIAIDSIRRFQREDGFVFDADVIYVYGGEEQAEFSEYGTTRIKAMTLRMAVIISRADCPEREFESLLKNCRDVIERDPELKTTATDATTALAIDMQEVGVTQPEYLADCYVGEIQWRVRYQYTVADA